MQNCRSRRTGRWHVSEPLEQRVLLSAGQVLDLNTTPVARSAPTSMVSVGGTVFFVDDDGAHGPELWKSDGTAAGTVMVKDINPGPAGSSPANLADVNGTLYFSANDGVNGADTVWKSDGTDAGTILIGEVVPGSTSAAPFGFTAAGGNVFFFVYESGSYGLWKTDAQGFSKLTDLGQGYPQDPVAMGGKIYFYPYGGLGAAQVITSDGTVAGTTNATAFGNFNQIYDLAVMGNTLYITASGGLYKSDGTPGGTSQIGTAPSGRSLMPVGTTLFYMGNDNVTGAELYATDGNTAWQVKDIAAGSASSIPSFLTPLGNRVVFSATDSAHGTELWSSDGTTAGTVLVADVQAGTGSSSPSNLSAVGNTLYFTADGGTAGHGLWRSDGTTAGTTLVRSFAGFSTVKPTSVVPGVTTNLFTANDGARTELWRTDGTGAGTTMVKNIDPATNASAPELVGMLNNSTQCRN